MALTLQGHNRNTESGQKFATPVAGSSGGTATMTIPALENEFHILDKLWFSWSGVGALAATGTITITLNGVEVLNQDVASSGIGPLDLGLMNSGVKNTPVVITLSAVTGLIPKLSCKYF